MKNIIVEKESSPGMGENTILVADLDRKQGVLIDPGMKSPFLEKLIQEKELNIEAICLTHGHYDHMLALPYYRDRYQAKVYAHEKEKEIIQNASYNGSLSMSGKPLAFDADTYFKDQDQITPLGLKVYHTPGHTSGSSCFEWEDYLFAGDTLFYESCGRWDLPTGNGRDMASSLKKLFQIQGDRIVECGHGPATSLDHERKYNPMLDYLSFE